MNKVQALNSFWNNFRDGENWKAYDSSSVPEDIADKRITFEVSTDDFDHPVAQTANLWDRGNSWQAITEKEMEIAEYIGRGGIIVHYDDGAMWIKKGTPWAQRLADSEDVKRIVLNIEVEFLN